MATADIPRLIDEYAVAIDASYDPLIEGSFEEHIQITERVNPGKRSFNNVPGLETRNVDVVGLVLHFAKAIEGSKLRGLPNRSNVEKLTLYADTVIVDTVVRFPATDVTIHARRLIIGPDGGIDTTPLPFQDPNARGETKTGDRNKGQSGARAGDIILLVQSVSLPPGRVCFTLNGSVGQGGAPGGLKDRPKIDSSKVPVTWEKVLDAIVSHDAPWPFRGSEDSWNIPSELKERANAGDLYYVKLKARNVAMVNDTVRETELGDAKAENADNGRDAIASGAGGNGGRGGTLRVRDGLLPKTAVVARGGKGGESTTIDGEPKKKDARTKYHGTYNVCNRTGSCTDGSTPLVTWSGVGTFPKSYDQKSLEARNGTRAAGRPGYDGGEGGISPLRIDGTLTSTKTSPGNRLSPTRDEWVGRQSIDPHDWLHPCVIEPVLQYTRDAWLKGDRRPASWLLPMYQTALHQAKAGNAPAWADGVLRNASSDIDCSLDRVRDNLDYFGNPVGWVPFLDALTTLKILKMSRPVIVDLLYFESRLAFAADKSKQREEKLKYFVDALIEHADAARTTLVSGQAELETVKTTIDDLERKLAEKYTAVRRLNDEATIKLKGQEEVQHAFTGACKVVGALCHFIPVGQPYLGEIGGGLAEHISQIDLQAKTPFENLKKVGDVSKEVGKFIKKHETKLTAAVNSELSDKVSTARGSVEDLDKEIQERKSDLASGKEELEKRFGDDVSILRTRAAKLRSARSKEEMEFYRSNEYAEMLVFAEDLEKNIEEDDDDANPLDDAKKARIRTELKKLQGDKKDLTKRIKNLGASKAKRQRNINDTATYLQGVGKGINDAVEGLEVMFTPVDEASEEFTAKLQAILDSEHKTKLRDLSDDVEKLNGERLLAVKRLKKVQKSMAAACQTLSTNLIEAAQLSDERGQESARQLSPMTLVFLRRMARDSWDMLRAEIYYVAKSYQYRFLRRAPAEMFDVETLIRDINTFLTKNKITAPDETDFSNAFDSVLKGVLLTPAKELLTQVQKRPGAKKATWKVSLTSESRTDDGRLVLEDLSRRGSVSFRLHELGDDSRGSANHYHYRIRDVTFTNVRMEFAPDVEAQHKGIAKKLSFRLTLAHSGESVIRADDGTRYFFTTLNPPSSDSEIQNVRSWSANYDAADLKNSETNGLENEKATLADVKLLAEFLSLDDPAKIKYTEHSPGATSELTLRIGDVSPRAPFAIKKLQFEVKYELVEAGAKAGKTKVGALAASAGAPPPAAAK